MVPVTIAMTIVLGGTFLHLISTSWMSEMRTPEIRAWNHRVTGKNHRRTIKATMATAIQIMTIPTEEIIIEKEL